MSRRALIPSWLLSAYHFAVAILGSVVFFFPSRRMPVIGVTGTKGKSSTTELINAIFEEANYNTALINSIRIKIGDRSERNASGRSMPGRFFLQRFLARAYASQCDIAIIEMTSEGARQHRHRGISMDALVFLNLAPEHIESHGSFEKYADAKFELGKHLARSRKRPRSILANAKDPQSARYLALPVEQKIAFDLSKHAPSASSTGGSFEIDGRRIAISLPGEFSLENALAAAEVARAFGIKVETIARALEKVRRIPGRADRIDLGQDFTVVIDYAHTPDSLSALLDTYAGARKICVLGGAGGGRDTWKRPVMGKIAEEKCDTVILSNDAPYGGDPAAIIAEIARDMKKTPTIIPDRRDAVQHAIKIAKSGDVVLLTGMGLDKIADAQGRTLNMTEYDVAHDAIEDRLQAQV